MDAITTENHRELENAESYDEAKLEGMIDYGFSLTLDELIRSKNLDTMYLVNHTSLSKSYINRLRNPSRKNDHPARNTVIDLALGMNCTLEETNLLLKRARYQELYSRDKAESVIIFGMLKNYDGDKIRNLLAEKGLYGIFKDK